MTESIFWQLVQLSWMKDEVLWVGHDGGSKYPKSVFNIDKFDTGMFLSTEGRGF